MNDTPKRHVHKWLIDGPTMDYGLYGITPFRCECGAAAESDPWNKKVIVWPGPTKTAAAS